MYFLLGIFYIFLGKLSFDFLIVNKKKNFEIKQIYTSFYPLIGIFIFGNVLLIFNFFTGLNKVSIFLFFLILFGISLIRNFKILSNYKLYFFNLSILLISGTNIGISKDANLYHLQSQAWLRDEKIIFGLSNINPYLGYSSIFEYINSLLWIENNYILIHFISLYIIACVFDLVFKFIRSDSNYLNNIGYVFLIVGFLDNFGFSGGRNGFLFLQETFKYDQIFSSLFLMTLILFLFIYKFSDKETGFTLFFFMTVFTIQTRFTGHIILLLFLFLIINKKFPLINKKNIVPVFLYLIFVFKNFLYSSCLWFPVSFTCIKIAPWHQPKQADYISNLVLNTNKLPNSKATDTIFFKDFIDEFLITQIDYVFNFLITLLIIIIFFLVFSKKLMINIFQISGSIILFFVWIFIAPTYRFGVPFFLSIYFIISYLYLDKVNINFSKNLKNMFILPLFFFVILAIIRGDSILELQNLNSISLVVEKKEIEFVNIEDNWWISPRDDDSFLCGTYKYCYVENFESRKIKYLNNYFYFDPINKNYYLDKFS